VSNTWCSIALSDLRYRAIRRSEEGVWLFLIFKFEFLMLVELAISHMVMPAALTLLAYGLSGTFIRKIKKIKILSICL
jgi:hypothetical protein